MARRVRCLFTVTFILNKCNEESLIGLNVTEHILNLPAYFVASMNKRVAVCSVRKLQEDCV